MIHRYLELTAELRTLRQRLATVPIEELIELLPPEQRPEIIPVPKAGERIVLARSLVLPEFAFLLWAQHTTSTRWQLRLAIEERGIRIFSVVCACCHIEAYGVPDLPKQSKAHSSALTTLRGDLAGSLHAACTEHHISTIFARRADTWRLPRWLPIAGVAMVEADEYKNAMRDARGQKTMQLATAWIASI
ncbi:hypothetical protein HY632_01370 [Candidatus Uhrbacteria bacterium]|nr:hypothetical protein [Candidatus Uhrbacteria bacterium]